jgi:hypothetical protein
VEVLSAMFDAVAKRSNAKFPQSRANPYSSINIPNTVQNSPLQFKELHYVILPQPDLFRGLGDSQPSNMAERTTSEEPSFTPFTKAERIEQLNEIDKSITALLQSAGLALQTLSSSSSRSHSSQISNKREAFQDISNTYLRTLQSVDVRLRRQIYGLEEANIIPAEKTKAKANEGQETMLGGMSALMAGQGAGGKEETLISVGEGGIGKLDIGWLNSRSGSVDRDMEAELWERAKVFMEAIDKTGEDGAESNTSQQDMES